MKMVDFGNPDRLRNLDKGVKTPDSKRWGFSSTWWSERAIAYRTAGVVYTDVQDILNPVILKRNDEGKPRLSKSGKLMWEFRLGQVVKLDMMEYQRIAELHNVQMREMFPRESEELRGLLDNHRPRAQRNRAKDENDGAAALGLPIPSTTTTTRKKGGKGKGKGKGKELKELGELKELAATLAINGTSS